MGCRHSVGFFIVLAIFSTIADGAEEPTTRPSVPALVVGSVPPRSFMARGIVRFGEGAGLAFHVATDGRKQVCAIYDPADGTPLFISDGEQTLVYDLANTRVVRVPISRGHIRVDWDDKKEKPLSMSFGVEMASKPEKLEDANSWFRIDRFIDSAHTLKRVDIQNDTEWFSVERKDGSIVSLQREPGNASWFRFKSKSGTEAFYRLELHVTAIDEQLPRNALAFPDPKLLPENVHLTELDQQILPAYLVLLRDGRAWLAKMALAAGPTARESAEKVMKNVDWDKLRERDATFGAAYRKALAEQGIELPIYPKPAATQHSR